jgi:hypothetical protein
MNKTLIIPSYINRWPLFYKDYNLNQYNSIIRTTSTLNWMNNIESSKNINDELENIYLSQMAFMHSRSYLIGSLDYENIQNEEDDFLNNMSIIHSRCEKHS